MRLKSDTFPDGGPIPKRCTCEGGEQSPSLRWSDAPPETKTFAVICEDPDAPLKTFVHWVLYNLPKEVDRLPEDLPKEPLLPGGGRQGLNGFGGTGYAGPCPPTGPYHRYFFTLYALDCELDVKAGSEKEAVRLAMQGHVLAEAKVMGRYRRVKIGTFFKRLAGLIGR